MHFLFGNERAAPAILDFLERTRVGKMPGRILLAGGPDLEEEELETFPYRWQERRKKGLRSVRARKRMGQALPSKLYFSFCFSFVTAHSSGHSFGARRVMGRRSFGKPYYNRASWFRVEKG